MLLKITVIKIKNTPIINILGKINSTNFTQILTHPISEPYCGATILAIPSNIPVIISANTHMGIKPAKSFVII